MVRKNPGVGNGDDEAAELMQQVNVLKLTVEDLEKERDFYFGKLRNIELICQENEGENDPVLQRIVDILYATDEGFVIPDEGAPRKNKKSINNVASRATSEFFTPNHVLNCKITPFIILRGLTGFFSKAKSTSS